jgi:hypothetical protein
MEEKRRPDKETALASANILFIPNRAREMTGWAPMVCTLTRKRIRGHYVRDELQELGTAF